MARQVVTMRRRMAVSTSIGTLARKNEEVGTLLAGWHAGTFAPKSP